MPPEQIVALFAATIGEALTVTLNVLVLAHPLAFVPVTV
jgi:putative NIF3 family GTP cyclohydrolase 1 type 2